LREKCPILIISWTFPIFATYAEIHMYLHHVYGLSLIHICGRVCLIMARKHQENARRFLRKKFSRDYHCWRILATQEANFSSGYPMNFRYLGTYLDATTTDGTSSEIEIDWWILSIFFLFKDLREFSGYAISIEVDAPLLPFLKRDPARYRSFQGNKIGIACVDSL